jgi:hypothetical protein
MLVAMRAPYVVAIVLVAACGSPAPRPASPALDSYDAAIAAFQLAWEHEVRPTIGEPLVRRIDNRMQSVDAIGLYHAQLLDCREGIQRLRELSKIDKQVVVHGTAEALLGRSRCWSVMFFGGMKLDAEGWLEAKTGQLLIVWRIPEG